MRTFAKIILFCLFILALFAAIFYGKAAASDEVWKDRVRQDAVPSDLREMEITGCEEYQHDDCLRFLLISDEVTGAPLELIVVIRPGTRSALLKASAFYTSAYSRGYPTAREKVRISLPEMKLLEDEPAAGILKPRLFKGELALSISLYNLRVGSGKIIAGKREFGRLHRICFAYESPKLADTGACIDITLGADNAPESIQVNERDEVYVLEQWIRDKKGSLHPFYPQP